MHAMKKTLYFLRFPNSTKLSSLPKKTKMLLYFDLRLHPDL